MKAKMYVANVKDEEAGWKALANAIIKQAVTDYIEGGEGLEKWFTAFIYGDYFTLLTDASPEYIYKKVRKMKDEKNRGSRRQTKQ